MTTAPDDGRDRRKASRATWERRIGLRERAHAKLDEALDMYEAGDPLWINTGFSWTSFTDEGARLDIWIKDNL